ncbi:MAG TPA: hypothetical protein VLI67_00715 [Vicinamibacteria bacterium]|nr:hypothetical protein [Vicinamibacteria bacterium]
MRARAGSALGLLALLLAGCGQPVPADRADYVGEWRAPGMYLLITRDGRVEYTRSRGGSKTSVSGPLQEFRGDDFRVGVLFLATTFVVSRPPWRDGDRWRMVVDGVELTRAR